MSITPRTDLELRTERPGLRLNWFTRICGRYFRRFLRPWRERVRNRAEERLRGLLERVARCQSRQELEALLGPPRYGMVGEGYGSQCSGDEMQHPDSVEYYEAGEHSVELWFKDGNLWHISGCVTMSIWDVVCSDDFWELHDDWPAL